MSATETAVSLNTEYVEVGVCEAKVGVKDVSKPVKNAGNSLFARTNFYIKQSQQYVGNHKLTCYWYIPYLYYGVITIVSGLNLFVFLHSIYAFVILVVELFCLIMYTQNMYVNIQTMRHVLKQPSVPNLKSQKIVT